VGCGARYDVVIRHGTVYDGSGRPGVVADVAIRGDRIAAVGDLGPARGRLDVDATGVRDVFVNGVPVLREGEHTGATPGRVVGLGE
jgi:N-acyl-D-aspartate/D-glutamate deacylase